MKPEDSERSALIRDLLVLHKMKNELLAEMLEITSAMLNLSGPEHAEEILSHVEARQDLIDRVDHISKQISALAGSPGQSAGMEGSAGEPEGPLYEMIEEVQKQRQVGMRLVEKMRDLDKKQMPCLEEQLLSLKKLQEKMRVSRQTMSAYRRHPNVTPSVFLDKKK